MQVAPPPQAAPPSGQRLRDRCQCPYHFSPAYVLCRTLAGGAEKGGIFAARAAYLAARRIVVAARVTGSYSEHMDNPKLSMSKPPPQEEQEMKVLKNFEALFIVVLGLACAANFALDSTAVEKSTPATAAAALAPMIATTPGMQVVVISAKRMSATEKAASLEAERKAAKI
jgi:hypothetical protein